MSKLKEFSVAPRAWALDIWGGGHTSETDPACQGWRVRPAGKNPAVVLVGRSGIEGCFSACPLSEGRIDVAFYDETPEVVASEWTKGESPDAYYVQLYHVPGWGLEALEILREHATDDVGL